MSKLPEALKLADQLETQILSIKVTDPAAAELRRLHAANVELLAVLVWISKYVAAAPPKLAEAHKWSEIANAAIAKHGSKS